MSVYRLWTAIALALLGTACLASACGSGDSGSSVDRGEGVIDVSINGQSTSGQPLACPGRTQISGSVDNSGPGGYDFTATLRRDGTAAIQVVQSVYKGEPITYTGTANVHLDSEAGPIGSLSGVAFAAGGGDSLKVAARFRCTLHGGGVYAASVDIDEHRGVALYFTVNHDGTEVAELIAAPQSDAAHALPNVQLRGSNIAINAGGTFRVSGALVAADSTGVGVAGRQATLTGTIDRTGAASGTIRYPSQVLSEPVSWDAAVAGPIREPTFPHAPLDRRVISRATIAADPAINLLYPGSTNTDGSPPGAPVASGETPQDQWANMEFAPPSGGTAAEAVREQVTPGSVYDVAAWYQERLQALGWQTATSTNFGNVPSLVFLKSGPQVFVVEFGERPAAAATGTRYRLTLQAVSHKGIGLYPGLKPGPPTPPLVPCTPPTAPASISISGTVTGTSSSTCTITDAAGTPRCTFPNVGFAVGQVRFLIWGPPYTRNGLTITGPHLEISEAAPTAPLQFSATAGALHMHGSFSGGGYTETVDVATTCTP